MLAETFLILTVMFIAVMGPSIVIGILGYAVIKALSRNPSAASKILVGLGFILVFVWAISIVAMLIIFQLFSNKQIGG
jgi:F0F1-type ATP synthase membrane subunit c/vacuolar-type H+-ATPase subunit K